MNRPKFALLSLIPISAVIVAAFYLSDSSSEDPANAAGNASGSMQTEAASRKAVEISARQSSSTGTSFTDQVKKLDPADYSSNPPMEDWEKTILKLAGDLDVTDSAKVQQLLAMMPRLPHEGKILALEHATRIIPDSDYVRLRPILLSHAATPELRETVLHDVLTRADSVRMPSLVELLRHPSYAEKTQVAEILSAYLDQDYGVDATKWEVAVKQWVVANPDI